MVNPEAQNDNIDCTFSCYSKQHATSILATITKRALSDLQIASYLCNLCNNFWKVEDETGKSALHMAAACGKSKLCLWLIKSGSHVNKREKESGWTPVHMAAYRGHILTISCLIKVGGRMDIIDNDGLTPLDLLFLAVSNVNSSGIKNQLCEYDPSLLQAYVWGTNSNLTLGIGTDSTRKNPQVLDQLKYSSINQIMMGEKHSIFVGNGEAWACGLGRSGRLGSGNEASVLAPVLIPLPKGSASVISAAVGDNHSLLLLSSGVVLSFGSNSHGQLGTSLAVDKKLSPRIVGRGGPLENCQVNGICAGKYHSVMYSKDELFVCGYNTGQLGLPFPSGDPCITNIVQVPIKFKGGIIDTVTTCAGATALSILSGDLYFLQNYIVRKVSHKLFGGIKQISLVGSLLSQKSNVDANEHYTEMVMLILNMSGSIYWCDPDSLNVIRVINDLRPGIYFNQITLAGNKLFAISNFQEAYQGTVLKHSSKSSVKLPVVKVDFEKIPNVFRGVSISVDPKGMNYAVLQVDPLSVVKFFPSVSNSILQEDLLCLLEEASLEDSLHDVIFKVGRVKFPCHTFVLSIRGNLLYKLTSKEKEIEISDTSPQIFKKLLIYLYTGQVQLIEDPSIASLSEDPLKALNSLCSRFKIDCLAKYLSQMKYLNGEITYVEDADFSSFPSIKMSRLSGLHLADVTLVAVDGTLIPAHCCILTARCEYFRSMLLGRWIESGCNKVLDLPFMSCILTDLIDFLYTEDSPSTVNADNLDYVVRLLQAADQLLILNLKEACEKALAKSLTLKNVQSIMELSEIYYTKQLNRTAIEFFCLNIMFYMESRQVHVINEELLQKISEHFRSLTKVYYNDIAPWSSAPTDEEVISVPPIQWPDSFEIDDCIDHSAAKSQAKSRRRTSKKLPSFSTDSKPTEKLENGESPVNNSFELDNSQLVSEDFTVMTNKPVEESTSVLPALDPTISFPPLSDLSIHRTPRIKFFSGKNSKLIKLGQKQRLQMKQLSPNETSDVSLESKTPSKVTKGWAVVPPLPSSQELSSSSPVQNTSDDFDLIIEFDRQKRNNFTRMKSKPFNLTQIEEQAIAELGSFYNIDSEFEESITITRLLPTNIDLPQWTKNTRKLFL